MASEGVKRKPQQSQPKGDHFTAAQEPQKFTMSIKCIRLLSLKVHQVAIAHSFFCSSGSGLSTLILLYRRTFWQVTYSYILFHVQHSSAQSVLLHGICDTAFVQKIGFARNLVSKKTRFSPKVTIQAFPEKVRTKPSSAQKQTQPQRTFKPQVPTRLQKNHQPSRRNLRQHRPKLVRKTRQH